MPITVKLTDNLDAINAATEQQIKRALIAVGMEAESNAKKEITKAVYNTPQSPSGYKRTGRLRNSITFALAGSQPNISSYKDDNQKEYGVSGSAGEAEHAVYVGTNVEYAQYIELGTSKMKPRSYIKPAVTNSEYVDRYKELVKDALKGGGT